MDFKKARYYMVEQQIRPWGVLDLILLDVLSDIPREEFILPNQLEVAYAELALPLMNGYAMLEPKIVARLIQSLTLNTEEEVLEIGTGSGYATAILAKLAKRVDTLDCDIKQLQFAESVLNKLDFKNIHFHAKNGLVKSTYQELGKQYDAIYIGGAIHSIYDFLLDSLKPNGRLVAIVGEAPIMKATLYHKNATSVIEKSIFETNVNYLQENIRDLNKTFLF